MGLSRRTSPDAVAQLGALLPGHSVHGVPVAAGLHLKSLLTALDRSTLLFADTPAGRSLSAELEGHPALAAASSGGSGGESGWQHVLVPDPVCANVLLLGEHDVVMQVGAGAEVAQLCLPGPVPGSHPGLARWPGQRPTRGPRRRAAARCAV